MCSDFQKERQEEILGYWFGRLEEDKSPSERHKEIWFSGGKDIDEEIKFKFELDLKRALEGKLKSWEETPSGSLALIILVDQFPRNMYRDTPDAFAGDVTALSVCLNGINRGFDLGLHPVERMFFYMPLMHSEDIKIQMISLEYFSKLENQCGSLSSSISSFISEAKMYAERHYLIVERFGRFPHRNSIFGRRSTPEEIEFLRQPGSRFNLK